MAVDRYTVIEPPEDEQDIRDYYDEVNQPQHDEQDDD